jgi:MazG family protein
MSQKQIDQLLAIMARLRGPGGCPWDREQNFATIAPYTLEEAYEVADAIERADMAALRDELGDLLFQVVFHARMAEEAGRFTFDDVVEAVCDKMIHRHPHVFGDAAIADSAAQTVAWEEHKARERAQELDAASAPDATSALDGVARALPALLRAQKLQKRAARVGFDWPEARPILDKLNEEMAELAAELVENPDPERLRDEFGDLLFVYVNLARHLKIDAEDALRHTNAKFERRFKKIEQYLGEQGKKPEDCSLEELEALWIRAKGEEG